MTWLLLKLARLHPLLDKWATNYFWRRQERNMTRFMGDWDVAIEDVSFVSEAQKGETPNT